MTGGRNLYHVKARIDCDRLQGEFRHQILPDSRDDIESGGEPMPFFLPRVEELFSW